MWMACRLLAVLTLVAVPVSGLPAAPSKGDQDAWTQEILLQLSELRKANGDLAQQVAKLRQDVDALRAAKDEPSVASFDLRNSSYPAQGKVDAPVALVEFSDFQCPFCLRYFKSSAPELIRKYVATGRVRYVFVDFPLGFHDHAERAAVAGACAYRQGQFWQMRDILFDAQRTLGDDAFKAAAAQLKLDPSEFDKCLNDAKTVELVRNHVQSGTAIGVSGTPTFLVGRVENGVLVKPTMITGAQPLGTFERALDAALAPPASG